jgi:uncharacterized delta-60 repeat protein
MRQARVRISGALLKDRGNAMKRSRRPLVTGWALWLLFAIGPAATMATNVLAQAGPAGTIDTIFSDSTQQPGRVLTDFRPLENGRRSTDVITAIAIQADGKIVAAGYSNSPNGDANFTLVRYNTNGVIDTSFGDNTQQPGRVLTDFRALANGNRSFDQITALAIQSDGKIVAGGVSDSPNGDYNFALVRYNTNGVIDTSFGDNTQQPGRVLTDFQPLPNGRRSADYIKALAIQADGKIIATGYSHSPNDDANFALVRYNTNGVIDTSFGDNTQQPGRVLTDFGALPDGSRSHDVITAVAIQSDGKIVAGGFSNSPNGEFNFTLARYNTNGVIDTSFGDNTQQPGRVLTDFREITPNGRSEDRINAITIQSDGKIVAGGVTSSPSGDYNFALVRYNANGVIDTGFGDNTQQPGRVLTDFQAITPNRRSSEEIKALAIQPDGKIVAAGWSDSPSGDWNFALVRYHGAPTASPPPGVTPPPPPATTGKINLTLTLDAPEVKGGSPVTGTVTLSRPAPAGGVLLLLLSDTPELASVPKTLTIPAGASSAIFPITTVPLDDDTPLNVQIYVEFADPNSSLAGSPDHARLLLTP